MIESSQTSPPSPPASSAGGRKQDPAKERILQVATELFSARGYADVSMQEIANAAGMTKAALYYHFDDKKALFVGVFVRTLTAFTEQMYAAIDANRPLAETLRAIASFVVANGRGEGRRVNTDVHTFISPEERALVFREIEHPSLAFIRFLEDQQARGLIAPEVDVGFAGPLFISMISGQVRRFTAASMSGLPLPDMTDDQIAANIVEIFLHGICAHT